NPRAPADDCAIRFPSRSVIEIIVLLNDAAICTMPLGTFFFSFLRKTFFFPPALAITFQSNNQTTSCRAPSSSRWWRVVVLCECARSCACAGLEPGVHDDGADRDSTRCPSN